MKNYSNQSTPSAAKKKGRFNIIDFLLILILLIVVAALIYVFLPTSWVRSIMADKSVDIQYTVEIKGVDEEFITSIKENDTVLNSVTKAKLGTVSAIDYSTPYTELEYNEAEKTGVLSAYPNKYNIVVTISATAEFTEGVGYTVNGTRIAVGEKISARFPSFSCDSYCISVPIN